MAEYAIQTWVGAEAKKRTGTNHDSNFIIIEFQPLLSDLAKDSKKIGFVQVLQIFEDGALIMPSSLLAAWSYRDADSESNTSAPDYGAFVDYVAGETAPYYNDAYYTETPAYHVKAPTWCVGKLLMGISAPTPLQLAANTPSDHNVIRPVDQTLSRMTDAPFVANDTVRKWKSTGNPGGRSAALFKFETFACSEKGADCPNWYEGITWEYSINAADFRNGRKGNITITGRTSKPSAMFTKAFARWNANPVHPFTTCL